MKKIILITLFLAGCGHSGPIFGYKAEPVMFNCAERNDCAGYEAKYGPQKTQELKEFVQSQRAKCDWQGGCSKDDQLETVTIIGSFPLFF